jgi:hypothetical protein
MKVLRIILGILAVIPIGLLAYILSLPPGTYIEDSPATLAYFAFGIPILIFNIWVWAAPQTLEFFFFERD